MPMIRITTNHPLDYQDWLDEQAEKLARADAIHAMRRKAKPCRNEWDD